MTNFFTALKSSPTGLLAGQTQWASSFAEYTDFVGLKQYKAMEDEYLPKERLENKYKGEKKIVQIGSLQHVGRSRRDFRHRAAG